MATQKPRKSRKSKERIMEQTKVVRTDLQGNTYVSHHVTKVRLPSEPPFVKLYIEDLSKLLNVKDAPKNLLLMLVQKLDYEGFISITPFDRERIANRLGINKQTLANYLQKLIKSNIIRNIGRGAFQVNPHLFAKGDWAQIIQQREAYNMGLELRLTYDGEKRQIEAIPRSEQKQLPFDEGIIFEDENQRRDFYKEYPEKNPRDEYNKTGKTPSYIDVEELARYKALDAAE